MATNDRFVAFCAGAQVKQLLGKRAPTREDYDRLFEMVKAAFNAGAESVREAAEKQNRELAAKYDAAMEGANLVDMELDRFSNQLDSSKAKMLEALTNVSSELDVIARRIEVKDAMLEEARDLIQNMQSGTVGEGEATVLLDKIQEALL
jgi:hypothetical protein